MKKFTVPASDLNLKWCSANLADADWTIVENCSEITIFHNKDFQKQDILTAIDKL